MEPAKSPVKAKRPAYRPMWEQAEREIKAIRELHAEECRESDELCKAVDRLESDLLTERKAAHYYWRNLVGFALVAFVEAVVIAILAAR